MTRVARHLIHHRRRWATVGSSALVVVSLSMGVASSASAPSPNVISTAISTSLTNASGQWATIPMGQLDQRLNTFWQLMVRPVGTMRWWDATNFAVATNGGLLMASPGNSTLVVGTRSSHLFHFSALAETSTAGKTWGAVAPTSSLADRTSALAQSIDGARLALTGGLGNETVQQSGATSSSWTSLISRRSLSSSVVAASCGPGAITAVAYSSSAPLVGTSCERSGTVGLYLRTGKSWRNVKIAVPTSLKAARIEVLYLSSATTGTWALLAATTKSGTQLVATSGASTLSPWPVVLGPLLDSNSNIVSIGPTSKGLFVLWRTNSSERLSQVDPTSWTSLPNPPTGTETASYGPGRLVQVLSVKNTALRVATLVNTRTWKNVQVMHVPIQFGSSH